MEETAIEMGQIKGFDSLLSPKTLAFSGITYDVKVTNSEDNAIDEKRNQISYNETTGRFSKSKYNFTNLDLYKIRGGRHNHLRLVNKMIGQVQVLHELVNSEDLLEELRKVKA